MDVWQWFAQNVTIPVAAGLIGWLAWLQVRMGGLERDMTKMMLKAAETYATKEDLKAFDHEVMQRFDRIESKLDDLIVRLSQRAMP